MVFQGGPFPGGGGGLKVQSGTGRRGTFSFPVSVLIAFGEWGQECVALTRGMTSDIESGNNSISLSSDGLSFYSDINVTWVALG